MRGGKAQFIALKENPRDEASRTLLIFEKQMTAFCCCYFVCLLSLFCGCWLLLFFLSVCCFIWSSSSSSNKRTHNVAHHSDAHRVATGTVSDKAKGITPSIAWMRQERRSVQQSFLKGRERATVDQTKFQRQRWGETSERRGGAHMGLPERIGHHLELK